MTTEQVTIKIYFTTIEAHDELVGGLRVSGTEKRYKQ